MSSEDFTSFDALFKEYYDAETVRDTAEMGHPFLKKLKKQKVTGDPYVVPIEYGNGGGSSADIATAIANAGGTKQKRFLISMAREYSIAKLDRMLWLAADGKSGAWADAYKRQVDAALKRTGRRLSRALQGNGSGKLGRLSATSGVTTSLTLADINDVVFFELDQVLVLSTADGGGTVKTGTTKVTGIDEDTGVITVDTSIATFSPIGAVSDYIFQEGDYDAVVNGLDAWNPATVTSTAFHTVDRSDFATRLAGFRVDYSALPVKEALLKFLSRASRSGVVFTDVYINPVQMFNLCNALGSDVRRTDDEDQNLGFSGIKLVSPGGSVNVYEDPDVPATIARGVNHNDLKLIHYGPQHISIFDEDVEALREGNADEYQIRCGGYMELACWNTKNLGRCILPSVTFS